MAGTRQLLLASSSPYRRELLARTGAEFAWCAPAVDETPQPGEAAATLVRRLAATKARAVADNHPDHLIIGADQVADCAGRIVTKPGSLAAARAQLALLAGQSLTFFSGLCVHHPATARTATAVVTTEVVFRRLATEEIDRYLAREPAFDCAGSFKAEGLGILLFDAITSDDPTALIGLPLIRLRQLLAEFGHPLL